MTSKELFLAADLLDYAADVFDGSQDLCPEFFSDFSSSEITKLLSCFNKHSPERAEDEPTGIPDFAWMSFLADQLRSFAIEFERDSRQRAERLERV